MLEVVFGILSALGDVLAPTPGVRWFWAVVFLMIVVAIIAVVTKMPL
jgi:hypothetical protein